MDRSTEPTELIYVPNPSWAPILVAAAIALIVAGTFMGWFLWLLGAVVLFLGVRAWGKLSGDEISRMRRSQRTDTAVIPAESIQKRSRA
jgi:hypothetical protein